MNDSQERLRRMLRHRGDGMQSTLTVTGIRRRATRPYRRPMRVLAPALVAASVMIIVAVVTIAGRAANPTVPPAGPGQSPAVSRSDAPPATTQGGPLPADPTGTASIVAPSNTVTPSDAIPTTG